MHDTSLLVVVPLYNEEANVDEFFTRLAAGAAGHLAGVVVVDDGSTDQTVTRVERYLREYPAPVRLVRLSRNFGHQSAVLAGCDAACKWAEDIGAQWIGVIDGDLQDRPEDFPALLDAARDQDVVYAVRAQRHDGFAMRTFAPLFYKALALTSTFPIPQNAGTFSVIRAGICRLIVDNADADPYFPGLRAWAGFRQKGIEFDRQPRARGESKVALSGLIRLSLRAFVLHSDLPLRAILYSTVALFAVLFAMALIVLVLRLAQIILPTGVTTIILLQIFSMGLGATFFTIIAFLLNRVKSNTSRQNAWMVMEIRKGGGSRRDRTPPA